MKLRAWLREHCEISLLRATFSPADETLPVLQNSLMDSMAPVFGSCNTCPKRSGSDPQLFGDIADPDVCTDPACYRNKEQAAKERRPAPPAVEAPPQPAKAPKAAAPEPEPEPVPNVPPDWTKAAIEQREQERARLAREEEAVEKTYAKTMDSILERIEWPLSQEDLVDIFAVMVDSFQCTPELADKFQVKRTPGAVQHDLIRASVKFQPAKIARMMFAGILLDAQIEGGPNNALLVGMARRFKVDASKIRKSVDAEIDARLGLRAQNPPPVQGDERKAAIAKLDTLAGVAPESGKWKCGMCGHDSPARFKANCQRCGALKGMGSQPEAEAAPAAKRAVKAKRAKAKASAKKAGKGARKGGKK
jgi:hypothetical protein